MRVLAACLVAAVALPSQESRRTLDELVERAERIVVARVERVHRMEGPDLLELAVERTLFGPETVRVFARVPDGFAAIPGASSVAFLDPWTLPEDRRIQRIVQDSPHGSALTPGALWPIDEGRLDNSLAALFAELGSVDPEIDALLAWLTARIAASLPTIEVTRITSGPSWWSFTVAADGSIRGSGAATTSLAPEALRALWRTLEEERVAELPRFVSSGTSGPCTSGWGLTVRTRAGRTQVTVFDGELSRVPAAERPAAERARRILAALPLAEANR